MLVTKAKTNLTHVCCFLFLSGTLFSRNAGALKSSRLRAILEKMLHACMNWIKNPRQRGRLNRGVLFGSQGVHPKGAPQPLDLALNVFFLNLSS